MQEVAANAVTKEVISEYGSLCIDSFYMFWIK